MSPSPSLREGRGQDAGGEGFSVRTTAESGNPCTVSSVDFGSWQRRYPDRI